MKKLILIFALLFINLTVFSQTIRRVNNTIGLNDPSVYATVEEAHDAAVDGDIIQLEPSDNPNYGDLTVTKKLTILGIGYNLENTPNTFFDKRAPKLNTVDFNSGSAKSTLMGLEAGIITLGDESITITRCKASYIYINQDYDADNGIYKKANKISITQCFFNYLSTRYGYTGIGYNCIISNNIIVGYIGNLYNSVVNSNVFSNNSSHVFSTSSGCVFTNNIIDARTTSTTYRAINTTVTGTTVSNNLCTAPSGLPVGTGNINGATANAIFKVANPWTVNPFIDSNVELSATSPAKTVGAGSTPIGIFAGNNPYVLSGVPIGPVITTLISGGFGTTSTPLNITTSVRSNN